MTTTARLGVDIVATDRTRAAFMSAQRSMMAFQRSMMFIKGAVAGLVGGNILAGMVRSFVQINSHVEPVKQSITTLHRAWQQFALTAGQGGLNEAIISFNRNISLMLVGSNSLASSLGGVLASAIGALETILMGVGRAVAFVYDNWQSFTRVLVVFLSVQAAAKILEIGFALVKLISSLRAASVAMALFHTIQRRGLLIAAAAVAITAKLTGSYADLQQFLNDVIKEGEELLPDIFDGTVDAIKRMGLDVSALTEDFTKFGSSLSTLPPTFDEIDKAAKKNVPTLGKLRLGASYLDETIKDMNQTFQSAFSSAFDSLIEGTANVTDAFKNMTLQILKSLTSMFANQAFAQLLNLNFGSTAPSQSGGLLSSLFGSLFGGFRAAGGPVSAGKSYLVGERGPELLRMGTSSGAIIPARSAGGGQSVQIIDQRGAGAPAIEQRRGPDGNLQLVIREAVNQVIGSGQADRAMSRFALSPAGVRR